MPVSPQPNGHIHMTLSGQKVFGTDEPPVQLIPDAWQSIPITISFPDFLKDNVYGFNMFTNEFTGITNMYSLSLVKILPQTTWLPDIVIGTVPPLINYVDWRVVLNWVKQPSPSQMSPAVSPIEPGRETDLRGGSGLIELGGGFRRMIHLGLSGQNIVLSRKQSTRKTVTDVNWAPGNATHHPSGAPMIGWTYSNIRDGIFAHFIDQTAGGNNVWRGGSNGASTADPTDYSSIWSGTLLVKPGRYNTAI